MSKKYGIYYLSDEFREKYNSAKYPEIERKAERPYAVLYVKINDNNFAIPFRTNVKHNSCYKFKNSSRNTSTSTGLDYSKAVIVNDEKYIDTQAFIDNKEYIELNRKFYFIFNQFKCYLEDYEKFIKGQLNEIESKKFRFTTLKYFHEELGIVSSKQVKEPKEAVPCSTQPTMDKPQEQSSKQLTFTSAQRQKIANDISRSDFSPDKSKGKSKNEHNL